MDSPFVSLISLKERVKLIMLLFFNPEARPYLRELAKEFGVSTKAVWEELNQLIKTNLLTADGHGLHFYRMANKLHPLFSEINPWSDKEWATASFLEVIVDRPGNLGCFSLI